MVGGERLATKRFDKYFPPGLLETTIESIFFLPGTFKSPKKINFPVFPFSAGIQCTYCLQKLAVLFSAFFKMMQDSKKLVGRGGLSKRRGGGESFFLCGFWMNHMGRHGLVSKKVGAAGWDARCMTRLNIGRKLQ